MASPTPRPIIRRRPPKTTRTRQGLLSHAFNHTSQNGEDGILARLFSLLPPSLERTCVDVGAWDGRHLSNTYSLLRPEEVCDDENSNLEVTTWRGVLIEAHPEKYRQLKSLYGAVDVNSGPDGCHQSRSEQSLCINATVSCQADSPFSLRNILNGVCETGFRLETDFDFLCIDVDGIDYWLLFDVLGGDCVGYDDHDKNHCADSASCNGQGKCNRNHSNLKDCRENTNHDSAIRLNTQHNMSPGNQKHYRPKVICIEFNPTMPNDLIYIQHRSDSIRHGSSLSALVELANSFHYVLVETTVFNAFFVPQTLYEQYLQKEVPDTSIEALHELTMGTQLYQLYDGTIKLHGCKKMLWHRLPLVEERMQMLSLEEREFPFAPENEEEEESVKKWRDLDLKIEKSAIDMSSYCQCWKDDSTLSSAELDAKQRECCTKLNQTLQKDGFVLVKGTNISSDLCIKALHAAKLFLHEADESVRRSCLTKDRARRGYSPMCTENFASLIGEKGPNDLVKKFRVGPEETERSFDQEMQMIMSSLHQPNAWPNEEVWSESAHFRTVIEEYYNQLRVAADCILRAICDGIIAENAHLETSIQIISESTQQTYEAAINDENTANHTSILTSLGYQPGSRHKKKSKGYLNPLVAAHTDVGMITVLLFDSGKCASLQRAVTNSEEDNNSGWTDVNLPSSNYLQNGNDPIFVVNVGDCLSELTGEYLRSTLHRVVPRPSQSSKANDLVRTSLALFVGLEQSAKIVLPSGESMTYEEWRKRRIARALDVVKSK